MIAILIVAGLFVPVAPNDLHEPLKQYYTAIDADIKTTAVKSSPSVKKWEAGNYIMVNPDGSVSRATESVHNLKCWIKSVRSAKTRIVGISMKQDKAVVVTKSRVS